MTYQGADGVQYVAIVDGVGGWPGVVANAQVDPRVRNGALGFVGATQDLPQYTQGGGELLVFSNSETAGCSAFAHSLSNPRPMTEPRMRKLSIAIAWLCATAHPRSRSRRPGPWPADMAGAADAAQRVH